MSGHTPGPWQIEESELRLYIQGNDSRVARDIASVYRPARRETADADARLIAAAPELLEALVEYVGRHEAGCDPVGLPEYEKARAAIAKAKGEEVPS